MQARAVRLLDLFLYVPERQLSAAEAKNDRLKIRPRPMIFTCSPPVPARSWVGAAAASEYLNILNISAQRADQTRMHVCDAWEHVPGRGAGVRGDVPPDDVRPAPLARSRQVRREWHGAEERRKCWIF